MYFTPTKHLSRALLTGPCYDPGKLALHPDKPVTALSGVGGTKSRALKTETPLSDGHYPPKPLFSKKGLHSICRNGWKRKVHKVVKHFIFFSFCPQQSLLNFSSFPPFLIPSVKTHQNSHISPCLAVTHIVRSKAKEWVLMTRLPPLIGMLFPLVN